MRETKINNCVPLSSAMLITDLNGVLSGHKVRKHSPEIAGKKRSHGRTVSERKGCPVSQPATSLLSHQTSALTTHHSSWT